MHGPEEAAVGGSHLAAGGGSPSAAATTGVGAAAAASHPRVLAPIAIADVCGVRELAGEGVAHRSHPVWYVQTMWESIKHNGAPDHRRWLLLMRGVSTYSTLPGSRPDRG
jgi:hypothetical protein